MNDFTRMFREVAYETLVNGFQEPVDKDIKAMNKLYEKTFPTDHAKNKVMLNAVNSMQYVVGIFMARLEANDSAEDTQKFTMWINAFGQVLLSDLEKGKKL
jgi:hypothetical protein